MTSIELAPYAALFNEYTELRHQENRNVRIQLLDGNVVNNTNVTTEGVSARVFTNGKWGFASDSVVSDASIRQVIRHAGRNASVLADGGDGKAMILPRKQDSSHHDFSTKRPRLTQKDLLEFVIQVDEHIKRSYPDLSSRSIYLGCLDMEKSFITADGSNAYSMIPKASIHIDLVEEKDGKPISMECPYGGPGQFEDQFSTPEELFDGIHKQHKRLIDKVEGVFPESGIHECIIDGELAGLLAHEAIGHTTEADLVMGGSVAGDMLDTEVASPMVSLVDFANTALGKRCPIPIFTDDEGTRAKDVVIIKDGILKEFMHNKESSSHFGVDSTGNARGFQFSDEPLIRMRNTAILPGRDKLREMIASIDNGYYLIQSNGGQADSTSEFMFAINCGYEIRNGTIGRALLDTTISGVAFDVLKSVTMASDEMSWECFGMCGKKQMIPTGVGGPAIKCKLNIGGK